MLNNDVGDDGGFSTLEAVARAGCLASLAEARGMCFQATLNLAREAQRLGFGSRAEFIRWDVVKDVDFLEHWALTLDDGRVLDMTAMQVDGDAQPVRHVDDYPVNYVRPRRYPAALILGAIDSVGTPSGRHYPCATLWMLHKRLFAHEAAAALRARSIRHGLDAVAAVMRTAFKLSLVGLLEHAIRRMSRLLVRLD